jgi:hypothetical protein
MNQSDPLYYYPMKDMMNLMDTSIHKYLPLELSPNDWSSLYIPYLNSSYTYDYLQYIIEDRYCIGKVKTIHFVKNPSPADTHKHDASAFIHFEYWYNSDFALFLRYCLNHHEKYDISRYYKYFKYDVKYNDDKNIPDRFHILINKSKNKHRGSGNQVYDILDEQTTSNRRSWENTHTHTPPRGKYHSSPKHIDSEPEKEYIAKHGIASSTASPSTLNVSTSTHTVSNPFMVYSIRLQEIIEKHERRIELLEEEITALRKLVQK